MLAGHTLQHTLHVGVQLLTLLQYLQHRATMKANSYYLMNRVSHSFKHMLYLVAQLLTLLQRLQHKHQIVFPKSTALQCRGTKNTAFKETN